MHYDCVVKIRLGQDRCQLYFIVKTMMNLLVPQKVAELAEQLLGYEECPCSIELVSQVC
jgi:hypothetical protein